VSFAFFQQDASISPEVNYEPVHSKRRYRRFGNASFNFLVMRRSPFDDFPLMEVKLEPALETNQLSKISQPLILAVDDDEDNLLLLTEVVTPLECIVITATDGQQALELATERQPALILLDAMLPDISGIEVVQQLKQNPLTMNIPVVAVTALARQEDRDRLLLAGCNDYISKPYMLDDLEAVINHHLVAYKKPRTCCCLDNLPN
jgi:CheY-like chemotaxis protein